MQAQEIRTEARAISSATSVEVVETLLKAGLGCITFMRDLLPQDNFQESQLTTAEDGVSCSTSSFFTPDKDKRNMSGFKIMTMSRGYTDEADRILNYLEYGIFDALRRQYLRSFIFAIYLDNKDPNNIVEAYTFNFQYHPVAGTDATVPVMTLGSGMSSMSLNDKTDPLVQAARNGNVPTLKDVKRSLKNLMKTLITSMTQMDVLPRRRYASFKLFYTDNTPDDYEPPHFKAGDFEKDKWYFMTHDLDEVPDTWSVGKLNSGHHSVNVNVSSIATYLPSSTEHDNAPFAGTANQTAFGSGFSLTPAKEAANRAEQIAKQVEDAENRNVAWSAEPLDPEFDADAEGDDDPEYAKSASPSFVHQPIVPIGVRNEDGMIEPFPPDAGMDVDEREAHFFGVSQTIPTGLKEVHVFSSIDGLSKKVPATSNIEQTQVIDESQEHTDSSSNQIQLGRDVSDSVTNTPTPMNRTRRNAARQEILSPVSSILSGDRDKDIDTQMEKLVIGNTTADDSEMLDLETQIEPIDETQTVDTIESFGSDSRIRDDIQQEPSAISLPKKKRKEEVKCECGITEEDDCCACEGGCERWYHIWYVSLLKSEDDARLPDQFICFDCRVHADPSWELIKVDLYPAMMSKLKELALFRRAIKVAQHHEPNTAAQFAKLMGCDNALSRQLWKRLETEGFIVEQVTTIDNIGFSETRSRTKAKGKGKQTKQRRNIQKQRYIFDRKSTTTQQYTDYFNPAPEVESRLLGIPQTNYADLKRSGGPCGDEDPRPKKKVKISLAPGIDLAE
ncbi:DNA-binding protein [Dendrothele bispora CBS 962.96]|uniref:DNA-binding protein n=1 Tax=Dendrothele bispora (strain CBS 962.96) TaxID=1314807 RepID=A0A4S8KZK1_DENBC|nr:DNA-binding protein [Dendrothele bispora CBS 962.96]